MDVVTRDAVRRVLLSWQARYRAAHDVQQWASDRYPGGTYEDDVVREILASLEPAALAALSRATALSLRHTPSHARLGGRLLR